MNGSTQIHFELFEAQQLVVASLLQGLETVYQTLQVLCNYVFLAAVFLFFPPPAAVSLGGDDHDDDSNTSHGRGSAFGGWHAPTVARDGHHARHGRVRQCQAPLPGVLARAGREPPGGLRGAPQGPG